MANDEKKRPIADEQMKQVAGGVMPILFASSGDRNGKPVPDDRLRDAAGGIVTPPVPDMEYCLPDEGCVMDPDHSTRVVYICTDPANKGKKTLCKTCKAR